MQIKIFTIPVVADEKDVEELNHFLRSHKIIDVKREITQSNGNSCWTFCIIYMPQTSAASMTTSHGDNSRREKVDYKEKLEPAVFERFTRMRKLRKQIAESEAIPAYAVFTDAELAEMAMLETLSLTNIEKIPGIGKKKAEKYGNAFCLIDQTLLEEDETGGTTD